MRTSLRAPLTPAGAQARLLVDGRSTGLLANLYKGALSFLWRGFYSGSGTGAMDRVQLFTCAAPVRVAIASPAGPAALAETAAGSVCAVIRVRGPATGPALLPAQSKVDAAPTVDEIEGMTARTLSLCLK